MQEASGEDGLLLLVVLRIAAPGIPTIGIPVGEVDANHAPVRSASKQAALSQRRLK